MQNTGEAAVTLIMLRKVFAGHLGIRRTVSQASWSYRWSWLARCTNIHCFGCAQHSSRQREPRGAPHLGESGPQRQVSGFPFLGVFLRFGSFAWSCFVMLPSLAEVWQLTAFHCSVCSRASYSQDRHLFHIVVHSGITVMCMADEVRHCNLVLVCTHTHKTALATSPAY